MGGHRVSPESLLGEDEDEADLFSNPLEQYARFREAARVNAQREREREAREYLPPGIVLADD